MAVINVLAGIAVVLYSLYRWSTRKVRGMDHIPGPKGHFIWGTMGLVDPKLNHFHHKAAEWAKVYGPVFKLTSFLGKTVVVSSYEGLHQVCITKGSSTSGRPAVPWRLEYTLQKTGVLFSANADDTWKNLRKISQRHLKQFGEGMTRLENIITEVAEDMFDTFKDHNGTPMDPKQTIFDTALKSISFLITGERLQSGDPLLVQMKEYEPLFLRYATSASNRGLLAMDTFPWLRHVFSENWSKIKRVKEIEQDIWRGVHKCIEDDPALESLAKTLLLHASDCNKFDNLESSSKLETSKRCITETDASRTCASLLLAGVSTTSNSFHALINILAHRKEVQDKILHEIATVAPDGRPVTLPDRRNMPYTRAAIYELLRYFTVVSAGVPHVSTEDVTIDGYLVPKNTRILTNLWELHHNKDLWGDPDNFRPERFLDDHGDLLPADHPNRKHLLPFGAGMRVCLGESLALARLFLWTATTVQRFEIEPAQDNDISLTYTKNYKFRAVLYSLPYYVVFTSRK